MEEPRSPAAAMTGMMAEVGGAAIPGLRNLGGKPPGMKREARGQVRRAVVGGSKSSTELCAGVASDSITSGSVRHRLPTHILYKN